MKLIIGLGNPGKPYEDSRHNIGFSTVKALAKDCKVLFKRDSGTFALSAKGKIGHQNVILAVPFTFMNLSGVSVGALIKKYKIDLDSLLVIYDDLDLEFTRLKILPCGSSGGHRGLKSIIYTLETEDFARLRVGIGRPADNTDSAEYVLSSFTKKEKEGVKEVIDRACDCCRVWVTEGITEAMNIFNVRSQE